MELIQNTADLSAYLAADEAIDHHHPVVRETAARLAAGAADSYAYARAAFDFVRDTIPHSRDSGDPRVTWRASDVLALGTGICYAKSHALAALLRAEDIPTALCYQRLAHDDGSGHAVHGLVAVRFHGAWHRQDPRGNKPGVDARFSLDGECLAWIPDPAAGEVDYPQLYARPHPVVLDALKAAPDRSYLWKTLPDALDHEWSAGV
ncbi:transglutaminase-like domain-containing protein [Streptomyces roseochromogenus]|uniref:Transglutaminase n=1 Tax=Streptomyces roseochromogenus subsp. oscitans DS 12.976 TaxID=1352936 RepID=V6JKQ8_STRRC|nr:transglutaminase family protein [Streptomyces roseochromogenus]EST20298.1 transglutaminase [Streptomyces roseochromogenus subsp. oscitans DS 12.976]